jgi:hypothetical protein
MPQSVTGHILRPLTCSHSHDTIASAEHKIFPPEWFGNMIELLEAELGRAIEEKQSKIFTAADFEALLDARQRLCSLHGTSLPQNVVKRFGSRISSLLVTDEQLTARRSSSKHCSFLLEGPSASGTVRATSRSSSFGGAPVPETDRTAGAASSV